MANPRKYATASVVSLFSQWQHHAGVARRNAIPRMPPAMLEHLFRRLKRWTWWRQRGGQRYFLLYRGMGAAEAQHFAGKRPGDQHDFVYRSSFTPDAAIASQFASRYGSYFLGVWVPESAIVAMPLMVGPELKGYDSNELEIFVDPFRGEINDLTDDVDRSLFSGWMGKVTHPWTIQAEAVEKIWIDKIDRGERGVTFNPTKNPMWIRTKPPTYDAAQNLGGLWD